MKLNLDRKDLISLAKGTNPNYRAMDIPLIKNHGNMGGPHGDQWSWNWNAFESESDEMIYEIYLICKDSWKEETDEEIKERAILERIPANCGLTVTGIYDIIDDVMINNFPTLSYTYEAKSGIFRVAYDKIDEIKKAFSGKVPDSWGFKITNKFQAWNGLLRS